MTGLVDAWFGPAFAQLDPRLQRLHTDGGSLRGTVTVGFGRGIGRLLGIRLARRLGIGAAEGALPFRVAIHSTATELHWYRSFGAGAMFASTFTPVGQYPAGYWVERSGALRLHLGVDIVDGAWHWRQRGARLHGIPIPAWLLPRSVASKRIEGGAYCFDVRISLPLVGTVLSYAGRLAADVPQA